MERKDSGLIVVLIILALSFWLVSEMKSCMGIQDARDTLSVRVDSVSDTVYITKHDTVPKEVAKRVVKYITLPASVASDSVSKDSGAVTLPVIQKTYTDDSTYTAYVSGVEYEEWPKLDSINIQERIINNFVRETITLQKKRRRWNIGIGVGYGYGITTKQPDVWAGASLIYAF